VTIRLLLADDQHLVRAGLAALLNLEPDLQVVQQLPDGTGVVEAIAQHAVDVAVLDIEMPEVDGITATQQIFEAYGDDIAVLILTTFGRAGYLQRTMAAGARVLWSKMLPPSSWPRPSVRYIPVVGRWIRRWRLRH